MLYTIEDQLRQLKDSVRQAQIAAAEAMSYAESTARLHHDAICRLNEIVTGQRRWPGQPQ